MDDALISVIDLANQLGKRKQTIFKVLKRLNVVVTKASNENSRGALIAYVSNDEAKLVREELAARRESEESVEDGYELSEASLPSQQGVFYLLLLEPDHDPGRFKVGFATSLSERLRTLRCSAPFTTVVKSWPCKLLWEKTAIECVSYGCERIHTEVFRTSSIDSVIAKCEQFFELMPSLS